MRMMVSEESKAGVTAFIEARALGWTIVEAEPCDLRVDAPASGERLPCTTETICPGGWISCAAARAMGDKHGVPLSDVGALLNALDIKIRHCELGCF